MLTKLFLLTLIIANTVLGQEREYFDNFYKNKPTGFRIQDVKPKTQYNYNNCYHHAVSDLYQNFTPDPYYYMLLARRDRETFGLKEDNTVPESNVIMYYNWISKKLDVGGRICNSDTFKNFFFPKSLTINTATRNYLYEIFMYEFLAKPAPDILTAIHNLEETYNTNITGLVPEQPLVNLTIDSDRINKIKAHSLKQVEIEKKNHFITDFRFHLLSQLCEKTFQESQIRLVNGYALEPKFSSFGPNSEAFNSDTFMSKNSTYQILRLQIIIEGKLFNHFLPLINQYSNSNELIAVDNSLSFASTYDAKTLEKYGIIKVQLPNGNWQLTIKVTEHIKYSDIIYFPFLIQNDTNPHSTNKIIKNKEEISASVLEKRPIQNDKIKGGKIN
jgi:hypothetical protein